MNVNVCTIDPLVARVPAEVPDIEFDRVVCQRTPQRVVMSEGTFGLFWSSRLIVDDEASPTAEGPER